MSDSQPKQTRAYKLPSVSTDDDQKGTILKVKPHTNGTHSVVLDNGPVRTISIITRSDQLPELLASDTKAIREHLMTRKPGHFRKKGTNWSTRR